MVVTTVADARPSQASTAAVAGQSPGIRLRLLGLLVVALTGIATACLLTRSQSERSSLGAGERVFGMPVAAPPPSASGYQAVFSSNHFLQGVAHGFEDEQAVYLRNQERAGPSAPYEESVHRYSTAYEVLQASPRIANSLYILGRARNHDWILEEWTVSPVKGGYFAVRQPAGGVEIGVVGGAYLGLSSRTGTPELNRRELYRGKSIGKIVAITNDPFGRFLLLLTEVGSVRALQRLDLDASENLVTLIDQVQLPELASLDTIDCFKHAQVGRIYLLSNQEGPVHVDLYVVLHDADENGVIDVGGVAAFTSDELVAAGYFGDVWSDDYVNYFQ